jgi:trk system potassium uptake protein TrkH
MERRLSKLPLFILLLGVFSVACLVPAAHGFSVGDSDTGRVFLYGVLLGLFLAWMLALAAPKPQATPRSQLSSLVLTYAVLPLLLAVPYFAAIERTTFLNAWFEMVSCLTTTGALLHDNFGVLNPTLHLWRGLVGWLGGLLVWVAALAVLAPMSLGGFEVRGTGSVGTTDSATMRQILRVADPGERFVSFAVRLLPIYGGLTAALCIGLIVLGEVPLVAVVHAMSVLSTSGISAIGGTVYAASGVPGEALMAVFMVFALSRISFSRGMAGPETTPLWRDAEVRLAALIVGSMTGAIFLRHFVGADTHIADTDFGEAMAALWGGFFTVLSFLTTTGFESRHWLGATDWSGMHAPGLLLLGLALIGGGVATTAGGVKLFRVYALFRHGQREMEKLVHPHSVGGAGSEARRVRRQGAQIAWLFFMLFTVSNVLVMGALTLTGVQFDTAMILTVSSLSTTGPLADMAGPTPILYSGLPDLAKVILGGAMILGRMEALALVALLNPELWRS